MVSGSYKELVHASDQLMAMDNAVRFQQLAVLSQLLSCDDWRADASNLNYWITTRYCVDARMAAQLVSVASKFDELPMTLEVFRTGEISWDQLASIASWATSADDALMAESAAELTLNQCRQIAREKLDKPSANDQHKERFFRSRYSHDKSWWTCNSGLPADLGAVVDAAIKKYFDPSSDVGPEDDSQCYPRRQADAFVHMAEAALGSASSEASRAAVVIHTSAEILAGVKDGEGILENGISVDHKIAQRLACNGSIQLVFENTDGLPIGVGRQMRFAPWWLERRIRKRDQGCRFPNCGNTRFTHLHHIDEWVKDRGPTDEDNLVELCSRHHHKVHEGGWSIRGRPSSGLEFVDPYGQRHSGRIPKLTPEVQARLDLWLAS